MFLGARLVNEPIIAIVHLCAIALFSCWEAHSTHSYTKNTNTHKSEKKLFFPTAPSQFFYLFFFYETEVITIGKIGNIFTENYAQTLNLSKQLHEYRFSK